MTAVAVDPVRSPMDDAAGRILGYDVARSLALLGMIAVHFGLVMAADPTRPGWSAWIMHGLDGRAAATFVILARAGLVLLGGQPRDRRLRSIKETAGRVRWLARP